MSKEHKTEFEDQTNKKQEAPEPGFLHLSKTAIANLQLPYNVLPVLSQQLGNKSDCAVKRSKVSLGSSFEFTW